MLSLGIAHKWSLLLLTRICENGKLPPPSELEGVPERRGRLLFSPKLGEMAQSAREVCLRAGKGRKSRKGKCLLFTLCYLLKLRKSRWTLDVRR